MSEWIEFNGTVSVPRTRKFSLKKHLESAMDIHDEGLGYSEVSTDLDTFRITEFRLSLISRSDTISKLQAAMREVPGTVSSVWVEGWLHL